MPDKTTLEVVDEHIRKDGEVFINDNSFDGTYSLVREDGSFNLGFTTVSTYVEWEAEWATFYGGEVEMTISNEDSVEWPHWVFEELSHIENHDELRPIEDYEEMYQLRENRGIKAME